MSTKITVRNTLNGEVEEQEPSFLDNPHFAKAYVEVPAGSKSFDPALYQPKTPEEYLASRAGSEGFRETEKRADDVEHFEPAIAEPEQAPKPAPTKKDAK